MLVIPWNGCACAPSVGDGWLVGVSESCNNQNGAQHCFVFKVSNLGGTTKPGGCQWLTPVVPNGPEPCPGTPTPCEYPAYKVDVEIADCAGTPPNAQPPDCGAAPYTITSPEGKKKTGRPSETVPIPFVIGDLACRGKQPYIIEVTASGGSLVARYQLIARCGKCAFDTNPLPPEDQ